jgi:hypothetical protein
MTRYLIELPHGDERLACIKALRAIEQYGSHFVTQAVWGCKAGVHSGWMIAELPSREEAMLMIPPEFRDEARIVQLNHFTPDEIASMITELEQ